MRTKQRVRLSKVYEFIGNFILETDHMWKWYHSYILKLSRLHLKLHFKGLILFLTACACVFLCVSVYVQTCRCVGGVDVGVVSSLQKLLEPLNSNYGYGKLQKQPDTLPGQPAAFWTPEWSILASWTTCFKFVEIISISKIKRCWQFHIYLDIATWINNSC